MSYFLKRIQIHIDHIREKGFSSYMKNRINKVNYVKKRIFLDDKDYNDWKKLKNQFSGKRVFLIGNGPSLNKTPLYLLKNDYKMCFNRFYLMLERLNWKIDFYSTVDNLVLTDLIDEIDVIERNANYIFLPDVHVRGEEYHKNIKQTEKIFWLEYNIAGYGFSEELPKVYGGGSVIYEGMQVLNYLGFREIILIGVDMNYVIHKNVDNIAHGSNDIRSKEDDDPNHFDPRYFGKGRSYHQPEQKIVDRILSSLEYVSNIFINKQTNIINAGYDSKVEYFPKKQFTELFDFSAEQVKELFEECISMNTKYDSLEKLDESLKKITEFEEAEQIKDNFKVDLKTGLDLYKKMIFTHLPLGPFENSYYFVHRSCSKINEI